MALKGSEGLIGVLARWCLLAALGSFAACPLGCLAMEQALLDGVVTDAQGTPMEGVVVSARKRDSTITISVVSDDHGKYEFPKGRLSPGEYRLVVRAAGYALVPISDVARLQTGKTAHVALKLLNVPVTSDQITNAELITSIPGPTELKRTLPNCIDCHSLHRIVDSKHTAQEFLGVYQRMGKYYPGASDRQPQILAGDVHRVMVDPALADKLSEWMAGFNLSVRDEHDFEYKTLPRASGRSTRVVITEYALPRPQIQPHDVVLDSQGRVWYAHFGEQILSKLDPVTGRSTDYAMPILKPGHPKGSLDLEVAPDGKIWVGMMFQGAVASFDPGSEKFRVYSLPEQFQSDATQVSHFAVDGMKADGKVWVKNSEKSQVLRLDPETGVWENMGSFRTPSGQPIGIYGLYSDSANNVYLLEFTGHGGIGRVEAKTGKLTYFPTPTALSRARRGRADSQDRLWFAEFGGNAVAMFDPKTEKITEWQKPFEWESPYDVVADRFGTVWEANESSDRLGRLNPATGEWVNYPLPRYSNIRRIFVDDRKPQVAIWVGNNLAASIMKIEPLD
jgi:virginiamycin B lyase